MFPGTSAGKLEMIQDAMQIIKEILANFYGNARIKLKLQGHSVRMFSVRGL